MLFFCPAGLGGTTGTLASPAVWISVNIVRDDSKGGGGTPRLGCGRFFGLRAGPPLACCGSIGRGLFEILVGFCLVVLSSIISKIIGGVALGCGLFQVTLSLTLRVSHCAVGCGVIAV